MYSKVTVIGRLGRDPEIRYLDSGQTVCDISVASDYKYNTKDGTQVSETTWWRVAFWGPVAENVNKYMKKGRLVYVEGRMRPDENGNPRVWKSSEGESRASYEMTGDQIRFLDRGEGDTQKSDYDENDMPF
ncbi:MAG: single-stranded DNA-binding protein [Candidatus Thorarchaeota archaeon]|jgi:single-strand DNA-binding protein